MGLGTREGWGLSACTCSPLLARQCVLLILILENVGPLQMLMNGNSFFPLLKSLFFIFSVGFNMLGGHFPVWALTLILGIVLAAVVFFTSKNDEQPKYHAVSIIFVKMML